MFILIVKYKKRMSQGELPIAPPRRGRGDRKIKKEQISAPYDFRHIAHISLDDGQNIVGISPVPLRADQSDNLYERPTSSQNGTITSSTTKKTEMNQLDVLIPVVTPSDANVERSYENRPSQHSYENIGVKVAQLEPKEPLQEQKGGRNVKRPSPKKHAAPPPPPQESKPRNSVGHENISSTPVFFRSTSNLDSAEAVVAPKISTPTRIDAPRASSFVVERPDALGTMRLGLDDPFPVQSTFSSPLFLSTTETPILATASPDLNYMLPSPRSVSAQGVEILDDLDIWLDSMSDHDRDRISQICLEETGFARPKDKKFIRELISRFDSEKATSPEETKPIAPRKKTLNVESKHAETPPAEEAPVYQNQKPKEKLSGSCKVLQKQKELEKVSLTPVPRPRTSVGPLSPVSVGGSSPAGSKKTYHAEKPPTEIKRLSSLAELPTPCEEDSDLDEKNIQKETSEEFVYRF
ncbi:unnamed protein product [Caenorhabditis auriculariae]|uniref:CRIB domain-containing protein n=1 Tax=Caenorhabditis auriculariae TaxID=2777116 RepID=A0A8S1GXU5_9PELO|nr:unnamed protein product [Caenorhabditis auriculariae]